MLIQKYLGAAKYILGITPPGPDLPVYADDTFLAAYPKSGNTWTRFLVGNLVHEDGPVTFLNIPEIIPHLDVKSKRFFKTMRRARVINCHEPFNARYKRVIYVVRDPRDVAVSLYHFQRKRRVIEDKYPIESFITRFLAGENVRPDRMGSWAENVTSWLAVRQNSPGFLLLRYEDLLVNPERELAEVASFLGITASPERIAKTVDLSSAHRMRELETAQGSKWHQAKGTRTDIPFVRSATSGGWRESLPQSSVAEMESTWGAVMVRLGYELSTGNTQRADG
jgi:hypothetical protein